LLSGREPESTGEGKSERERERNEGWIHDNNTNNNKNTKDIQDRDCKVQTINNRPSFQNKGICNDSNRHVDYEITDTIRNNGPIFKGSKGGGQTWNFLLLLLLLLFPMSLPTWTCMVLGLWTNLGLTREWISLVVG